MAAYVALLRGIAPANPKMRNAALIPVFEDLGLTEVATVLSSGNVLFETPERSPRRLEGRIETALRRHLGARCCAIVRTRHRIERLVGLDVFDAYDDGPAQRCSVTFLQRPSAARPPADEPGAAVVAVRDACVFTVIDTTTGRTPGLLTHLEEVYGTDATMRSWRTVRRIAAALDR